MVLPAKFEGSVFCGPLQTQNNAKPYEQIQMCSLKVTLAESIPVTPQQAKQPQQQKQRYHWCNGDSGASGSVVVVASEPQINNFSTSMTTLNVAFIPGSPGSSKNDVETANPVIEGLERYDDKDNDKESCQGKCGYLLPGSSHNSEDSFCIVFKANNDFDDDDFDFESDSEYEVEARNECSCGREPLGQSNNAGTSCKRCKVNVERNGFRSRQMSENSEDSYCIVFKNDSDDEEEDDESESDSDLDEESDDLDVSSSSKDNTKQRTTKVKFDLKPMVHPMIKWDYAYRAARKGPWEEMARDRDRFKTRILCTGRILEPILNTQHRSHIWEERFDNSQ